MKGSRSGSNHIVCGECGGIIEWDYLDEVWRHVDGNTEECIETGRND